MSDTQTAQGTDKTSQNNHTAPPNAATIEELAKGRIIPQYESFNENSNVSFSQLAELYFIASGQIKADDIARYLISTKYLPIFKKAFESRPCVSCTTAE